MELGDGEEGEGVGGASPTLMPSAATSQPLAKYFRCRRIRPLQQPAVEFTDDVRRA